VNFPTTTGRSMLRSVLLGASSGLRSQMGLAAVVVGPEGYRVPSVLRTRTAKVVVALLAGGELLGDKSSKSPNRTDPPSLLFRLALGAGSAGLLARSEQEPLGPAASVGALAAVAATFAGFTARRGLSASHPPLAVAIGEDALSVCLAALAVTWFAGSR
jgi:uncharacterized membrane protein